MKNLLPLLFALFACHVLSAQTVTKTSYAVDENSVIRDSTGHRLTKLEFYQVVMSGEYQFKPVKDDKGMIKEFTLVRVKKSENNTNLNVVASTTTAPATGLKVGDDAPEMTGADLVDSTIYDLAELKGQKVIVLNFWFSTCKPCIEEVEDLNRLQERYKDRKDIIFIAPTFDYPEIADSFLTRHPFHYIIIPEAYEAVRQYKAVAFPLNVIIGLDGKIAYVSAGGLPGIEYVMDRKIRELLQLPQRDPYQGH